MTKPAVFIGSSTEGLEFARAIRTLLVDCAEIKLWQEGGIFEVGDVTIDALINALPRFDFAVLVLSPDDVTTSRDKQTPSPRDNVIFEFGLFMGRLGRSRTFMVRPRETPVKLPSDVAGLTAALYDWPRQDKDHRAAVGPACDDIRQAIRSLGIVESRVVPQIREVQRTQEKQQSTIDALTFVVAHFLPKFELEHLQKLASNSEFTYDMHPGFDKEIRQLWALRFIRKLDENSRIADMPRHGNLRDFFVITEEGRTFLQLHETARANSQN